MVMKFYGMEKRKKSRPSRENEKDEKHCGSLISHTNLSTTIISATSTDEENFSSFLLSWNLRALWISFWHYLKLSFFSSLPLLISSTWCFRCWKEGWYSNERYKLHFFILSPNNKIFDTKHAHSTFNFSSQHSWCCSLQKQQLSLWLIKYKENIVLIFHGANTTNVCLVVMEIYFHCNFSSSSSLSWNFTTMKCLTPVNWGLCGIISLWKCSRMAFNREIKLSLGPHKLITSTKVRCLPFHNLHFGLK